MYVCVRRFVSSYINASTIISYNQTSTKRASVSSFFSLSLSLFARPNMQLLSNNHSCHSLAVVDIVFSHITVIGTVALRTYTEASCVMASCIGDYM